MKFRFAFFRLVFLLLLVVVLVLLTLLKTTPATVSGHVLINWVEIWSDEFNGSGAVSPNDWIYDLGTQYPCGPCPQNWGTGEVEVMTSNTANVFQSGGNLNIRALHAGSNPTSGWTSGRIETVRTDFQPPAGGAMAVEVRLQQPEVNGTNGIGYWPAAWMLGAPFRGNYLNWPGIGEIDIVEQRNGSNTLFATLHCGSFPGGPCNEGVGLSSGERPCPGCTTAFHTYRMEFDKSTSPEEIRWYLDGTNFFTIRSNQVDATTWNNATNHGFFILFDLAIGGVFPGHPNSSTVSGGTLVVDYVRVYYSSTAPPPTLQLSQSSFSVNESSDFLSVDVTRSGDTSVPATVKYATSDATDVNFNCNPSTPGQIAVAASRKCDYHILSGRLRFAAGESSKPIILSVVNDVYVEPSESLTITLSNPTGATLGTQNTATINITDNDTAGQANPIDGTSFYVRMLYVDLLSREPDPAGFAGWVHRIDFCGQPGEPPPPCDRVTVGGDGFLRSGEFFDREFFVLRLYRAGLGRILVYSEVGDLAYVSGFLTASDLELNKQELITEIMSRSEFSNIYNGLSNSAYVDRLIQTAAVSVPTSVRDGWVSALNGSTKTRAQVYRELSERQEVSDKYLREAQVVSCYYGFFTRNPDGAYFTYLDRLTRGEITLGDLANAFINAAEYRQRFGP